MIESSSIQSVREGEKEFVIANDKVLSAGFVFYTSLVSPTSNHFMFIIYTTLAAGRVLFAFTEKST